MKKKWTKLPQVPDDKIWHGCLTCGGTRTTAPLYTAVSVGFGYAAIAKDGIAVYIEPRNAPIERPRRLRSFEKMARKDPNHDWRLILDSPLRNRTYQRQGYSLWVLVESGPGFA